MKLKSVFTVFKHTYLETVRAMSTSFQHKIFETCLAVTFFFVKAFGFWLYKIDHRNRTIKYNFVRIAYSICFSCFLVAGYFAVGREFVYATNRKLFVSFAFQSIFSLHTYIIVISCVSLYLNQYREYEKRQFAYEKCREVIDSLKFYHFKMLDNRKYLVLYIIKAVVIDVFVFITLWFNWRIIGVTSSFSQLYLLAFTFLPLMILRFYTNLFYGGILIIEATFKRFNQNLNDIVLQARLLYTKNGGKSKLNSLLKYCELSEEIERLSRLHAKLIEATTAFNSIFSVQMVLSVISLLLTLVLRCFYQYIAIVEVITKNGSAELYRCFFMCCVIFTASYDLYSTSDACESLVTQVRISKKYFFR